MRRLFDGERGPIRDVVLLNSGAALVAGDRADSILQGIEQATQVLDSGEPRRKLAALVDLSQRLGRELGQG
jgi:anthranilate phosphoribosyltransferase